MSNEAANGSTPSHSTKSSSTNQTSESKQESKSSPTTSKCSTSKHAPESRRLHSRSPSNPRSSPPSSATSPSSPGPAAQASLEALSFTKDIHDYALPITTPHSFLRSSPPCSEISTAFFPALPVVPSNFLFPPREPQNYEVASTLEMFLEDETYAISGCRSTYINALVYTYGFPDDLVAQEEIEGEMVVEAESRARRLIEDFDRHMEAVGS